MNQTYKADTLLWSTTNVKLSANQLILAIAEIDRSWFTDRSAAMASTSGFFASVLAMAVVLAGSSNCQAARLLADATPPPAAVPGVPAVPAVTLPPMPAVPAIPTAALPPIPAVPTVPNTALPPMPAVPKVTLPPMPAVPAATLPPMPAMPAVPNAVVPPMPAVPKVTLPPMPSMPAGTQGDAASNARGAGSYVAADASHARRAKRRRAAHAGRAQGDAAADALHAGRAEDDAAADAIRTDAVLGTTPFGMSTVCSMHKLRHLIGLLVIYSPCLICFLSVCKFMYMYVSHL
uniref:Uncharacterized protein n=1 Tax=Oryza brachyantha TaxID=4533 RepID=J3MIH9_ORYBR